MNNIKNTSSRHKHDSNSTSNSPNYESLYFRQLELLKSPTSKNCEEVIELGSTILNAADKYIFSTGSCTNVARANLMLLYKTKCVEYLDAAKKSCEKALSLKPENQQALLVLYEININMSDFVAASQTIRSLQTTFLGMAQEQILIFYQQALDEANRHEHSLENKNGLDVLTNTLFKLYGEHPALCGIATSYYIGIGNDVIRAYEVAKKCVNQWPNAEIYCSLGLICITPPLNRVDEAIMYLKKGLDICDSDEVKFGLKSNLLSALIKAKDWAQAEELGEELIKKAPSNMNYHNYAELLKHLARYDEATDWCKKALFLVEDDCTLLTLADIYRRNKKYEDAVATYLRCLASQECNGNSLTFIDENGSDIFSLASSSAINGMKLETFKGLIQSYTQQQEYDKAKAYLVLGQETLGDYDDWAVWESVLPILHDFSRAYSEARKAIEEAGQQMNLQKNYFKQWASTLMQLQGTSQQVDLDQPAGWSEFESQMDLVLEEMKASIINHSALYDRTKAEISSNYPHLAADSQEFLVTANILYNIHQNSFIDFAPIIVEYSKVVEKQLRILLAGNLPTGIRMLGQIIAEIDNNSIAPYNLYLVDLRAVNQLRKDSAHVGRLTKVDADNMRNILFSNGLLNQLV